MQANPRPALNPAPESSPAPTMFHEKKGWRGASWLWPRFPLPQGWQWPSTQRSSSGWTRLPTTHAHPQAGHQSSRLRLQPHPAAVGTRRCVAAANRSCSSRFPNTSGAGVLAGPGWVCPLLQWVSSSSNSSSLTATPALEKKNEAVNKTL